MNSYYIYLTCKVIYTVLIKCKKLLTAQIITESLLIENVFNLQMVMHEPWKASAPEVHLLTTTDGSVPRGLDPNDIFFWQAFCYTGA